MIAAAAAVGAEGAPAFAADDWNPRLPWNPFDDLGVASGDPTAESVLIWTRLCLHAAAEDGLGGMPFALYAARYDVSTSADFNKGGIVASGSVGTVEALGYSMRVRVTGLQPDTAFVGTPRSSTGKAPQRCRESGEWPNAIGTNRRCRG
ncbi:PhoD-like phosphatase N-terminal domain-containing protein [Streptomyces marianii]|uniref:PhoD-like phosphatase N-terminal domain-containing protein n=1 Tax=Streptomyces marianii TaxID=1817406 RepID=UPI001485CE55|nr:PhoD-like phosphatase N-terminal domain-containing protein [Streptomyces marianii]